MKVLPRWSILRPMELIEVCESWLESKHLGLSKKKKGAILFFFMKTIFENIENTIFVFFKTFSCFPNLMFHVSFMVFRRKKKRGKKEKKTTEQKTVLKNYKQNRLKKLTVFTHFYLQARFQATRICRSTDTRVIVNNDKSTRHKPSGKWGLICNIGKV